MKPQFWSRRHEQPRETQRGACAVRHSTNAPHTFELLLLPPQLHRELRRYDLRRTELQTLAPEKMASQELSRVPYNLLSPVQCTKFLRPSHPKRCAPNREVWTLLSAKMGDCGALKAR